MLNQYAPFGSSDGNPFVQGVFVVLVIWSIAWKLVALWKAARNDQKVWFFFIFLVNALGIVELVYLGFFQKGQPTILEKLKNKSSAKKRSK